MIDNNTDQLCIEIIIKIAKERYGYDFSNYAATSLKRRIIYHQTKNNLQHLSDIIPLLLKDANHFSAFLKNISITVTEFFRDPYFYSSLAEHVFPKLKTYSYAKIWHAGCATGEEVYSTAILLDENNLLKKTRQYATDFNPFALATAKKAIYPSEKMSEYTKNYDKALGKKHLNSYFIEKYHALKIKKFLQKNIVFSEHNLAVDSVFSRVEVVICRNVMIYFNKTLREHVINLFSHALVDYGFLCLGNKESISHPSFKCIDAKSRIYQKVGHHE